MRNPITWTTATNSGKTAWTNAGTSRELSSLNVLVLAPRTEPQIQRGAQKLYAKSVRKKYSTSLHVKTPSHVTDYHILLQGNPYHNLHQHHIVDPELQLKATLRRRMSRHTPVTHMKVTKLPCYSQSSHSGFHVTMEPQISHMLFLTSELLSQLGTTGQDTILLLQTMSGVPYTSTKTVKGLTVSSYSGEFPTQLLKCYY